MPEKPKNAPSPGLAALVKNLLKGLPPSPISQSLGLADLLQQMFLNKIMSTAQAGQSKKIPRRSDLFPPVDPFRKMGQQYSFGVTTPVTELDDKGYSASTIGAANRPEGTRFYEGQGYDPNDQERAFDMAEMALEHKIMSNPADSITTARAKKLVPADIFKKMLEDLQNNPDYLRKLQTL